MPRFVLLLTLLVPALALAEPEPDAPTAPDEDLVDVYEDVAVDDDDSADPTPEVGVPLENRVPGGGCDIAGRGPASAGLLLGLGLLAVRRR